MPSTAPADPPALRLAMAIARVRARLREIDRSGSMGLTLSQLSALNRLRRDGPATAASLAAAEHVSQQAIAQILTSLRRAGLVEATPDPADRRKCLLEVTDAGHALIGSILASRNAWLVRAVEQTVGPDELDALDRAIDLLERLADAPA
jgi:DNA-binding MarR family transcriptional regulator